MDSAKDCHQRTLATIFVQLPLSESACNVALESEWPMIMKRHWINTSRQQLLSLNIHSPWESTSVGYIAPQSNPDRIHPCAVLSYLNQTWLRCWTASTEKSMASLCLYLWYAPPQVDKKVRAPSVQANSPCNIVVIAQTWTVIWYFTHFLRIGEGVGTKI